MTRESPPPGHPRTGPTRREVLGAAAAAGAALPLLGAAGCKPAGPPDQAAPAAGPRGTPSDPDLIRPRIWWSRQLGAEELATLAALCDTIIPADERSPAASAVGVPAFIDEWASAPYDWAREGLARLRAGFAWLDAEGARRFGRPFAQLTPAERDRIAGDICYLPRARPEHQEAARFFDLVRDLTATGFYTTREGMADIGYVGNTPLDQPPVPPPEVLRRLGLPGPA